MGEPGYLVGGAGSERPSHRRLPHRLARCDRGDCGSFKARLEESTDASFGTGPAVRGQPRGRRFSQPRRTQPNRTKRARVAQLPTNPCGRPRLIGGGKTSVTPTQIRGNIDRPGAHPRANGKPLSATSPSPSRGFRLSSTREPPIGDRHRRADDEHADDHEARLVDVEVGHVAQKAPCSPPISMGRV